VRLRSFLLFQWVAPKHAELPRKTAAYRLAHEGKLDLVRTPHGVTGLTAAGYAKWMASCVPVAQSRKNVTPATLASLTSRGKR
jgi:hypothetical protein